LEKGNKELQLRIKKENKGSELKVLWPKPTNERNKNYK
jgi:hypothetical protein